MLYDVLLYINTLYLAFQRDSDLTLVCARNWYIHMISTVTVLAVYTVSKEQAYDLLGIIDLYSMQFLHMMHILSIFQYLMVYT